VFHGRGHSKRNAAQKLAEFVIDLDNIVFAFGCPLTVLVRPSHDEVATCAPNFAAEMTTSERVRENPHERRRRANQHRSGRLPWRRDPRSGPQV